MLILLSAISLLNRDLWGLWPISGKRFQSLLCNMYKNRILNLQRAKLLKKKKVKEKRKSTTKVSASVPDCGNKAKIQDEALYCTSCSNILGSPILRPLQIGCSCSLYCRENFNQRNSEAHKSKLDTPLTGGKDGKNSKKIQVTGAFK